MFDSVNHPPTSDKCLRLMRYIHTHIKIDPFRNEGVSLFLDSDKLASLYGIDKSSIELTIEKLKEGDSLAFSYWQDDGIICFVSVNRDFEKYYSIYEKLVSEHESVQVADSNLLVPASNELVKSSLRIDKHTLPIVTIEGQDFTVSNTYESRAIDIVFCSLKYKRNITVSLTDLKALLEEEGRQIKQLSNVRETLRKSVFGKNAPLSPFVNALPQSITVYSDVYLNEEQVSALINYSQQM